MGRLRQETTKEINRPLNRVLQAQQGYKDNNDCYRCSQAESPISILAPNLLDHVIGITLMADVESAMSFLMHSAPPPGTARYKLSAS